MCTDGSKGCNAYAFGRTKTLRRVPMEVYKKRMGKKNLRLELPLGGLQGEGEYKRMDVVKKRQP